ncbi:MAG: polysaccharide deacetylase family protein [Candidatus Parcubacteria bacterium]|nr:polysaccharide deacetylase family protein [Candidatus Parcubacteria bacterium]
MDIKRQFLLDILIAILVVAVIILVDNLFINLKSKPADDNWFSSSIAPENVETSVELQPISGKAFIPILNFHHIDTAPAKADKVTRSFYVVPAKFEQIINDLLDNDYRPVFMSEVADYLGKKQLPQENIMAITFDDGNEDFYTNAWPILQKYKIKSSLYIMTGVKGKSWLTPEQILELDKSGLVEFGSHTVWHPKLTKISEEEQRRELVDSKEFLGKLLNKQIEILCYPFGLYNDSIKALAKEVGYKASLTFDQDAWQNPDDLMALTRISVYPGLDVMKFLDKLKTEN